MTMQADMSDKSDSYSASKKHNCDCGDCNCGFHFVVQIALPEAFSALQRVRSHSESITLQLQINAQHFYTPLLRPPIS